MAAAVTVQSGNLRLVAVAVDALGPGRVEECPTVAATRRGLAFREALDMVSASRISADRASVDQKKCAVCLTCVRVCPHGATVMDYSQAEKKVAATVIPEACHGCGICVGECPAAAISIPLVQDLD